MTIANEKKKRDAAKPVVIVLTAFLLVPLVTATLVYFVNTGFRTKTNDFFAALFPNTVGTYFKNQPTQAELDDINRTIAKHYITYEDDRLTDKLLLLRAENQQLYQELLLFLNRENSVKMGRVQELIRRNDLSDDVLQRIFQEIDTDTQTKVNSLVTYYTSLRASDAVKEIERTFASGELTTELLPLVFQKLDVQISATYLAHLNGDLVNAIRFRLSDNLKQEIDKQIETQAQKKAKLVAAAGILENKTEQERLAEIGGTDRYNLQDLAQIYMQLSLEKGGSVLAKAGDTEFINGLYDQITELEKLNEGTGNYAKLLADTAKIYQEYNAKVTELAQVYQRITVQELASIADQMLRSNQTYQEHVLEDGQRIVFTQNKLLVDVFRLLKPTLVASVMESMDTARAVELSRMLMVN